MTLGFERTLPKGSGTIFSHFETVEDLMIMFIINAGDYPSRLPLHLIR
jgi:hypothetical protein